MRLLSACTCSLLGACDKEALPCCADCSSRQAVSLKSTTLFPQRLPAVKRWHFAFVQLPFTVAGAPGRAGHADCAAVTVMIVGLFECSTARPAAQIATPHFIMQVPFTPPSEQDKRALLKHRAAARNRRLVGLKLLAAGGSRVVKCAEF